VSETGDTALSRQNQAGAGIIAVRINIVRLGTVEYGRALEIQRRLLERRIAGEIDNTLLLLEHPPVLTLGTRGDPANVYLTAEELESRGVKVFRVERGGDVTYHGPGQLVGYPIVDLRSLGSDIRKFIRNIGQTFVDLLGEKYGIAAEYRTDKYAGVWVGDEKITAVGIAIRRWVTMHGFAFNVNTNLEHFGWINPCGLSAGVTSLKNLTGREQDMEAVRDMVACYFAAAVGCEPVNAALDDLI